MSIFQKLWPKKNIGDEWIPGVKHPNTPAIVFRNCWGQDLVRRVVQNRCHECGYVIPSESKELLYICNSQSCTCKSGNPTMHPVCEVCFAIFHSLYLNYNMAYRNYFRDMDDEDRKNRNDWRRRDKLGL